MLTFVITNVITGILKMFDLDLKSMFVTNVTMY